MGIFANRRARKAEENAIADEIASIERLKNPRNAVSAFKQRMAEDPDYEAGFIKAMFSAKEEADERGRQFAADYFGDVEDPQQQKRRTAYGLVAGRALVDIIDIVSRAAEYDTDDAEENEAFIRQIGQALLELADEAYFAGSISLQNFRQGALAINDPEFGTLIAWERAQEAGMDPEQMGKMSYIYQQLNGDSDKS